MSTAWLSSYGQVPGVNHNTVIQWVRQVGLQLPAAAEDAEIVETAQIDELSAFVRAKKTKFGS